MSSEGKTEEDLKNGMNSDSERELKLSFALTEVQSKKALIEDIEVNQGAFTAHALRKNVDEIFEYVESLGREVLIRSESCKKALGYLENLYRKDSVDNDSDTGEKLKGLLSNR